MAQRCNNSCVRFLLVIEMVVSHDVCGGPRLASLHGHDGQRKCYWSFHSHHSLVEYQIQFDSAMRETFSKASPRSHVGKPLRKIVFTWLLPARIFPIFFWDSLRSFHFSSTSWSFLISLRVWTCFSATCSLLFSAWRLLETSSLAYFPVFSELLLILSERLSLPYSIWS